MSIISLNNSFFKNRAHVISYAWWNHMYQDISIFKVLYKNYLKNCKNPK